MTKDEYILSRLKKIQHKEWELFIISRIIHRLDDPEIEFITQQYVRLKEGKRALTDLYFPQLGNHLEIDERHHADPKAQHEDLLRTQDIIERTGDTITRIRVFDQSGTKLRPLREIREETDRYIETLRSLKLEQVERGVFVPWNYELRFDPRKHYTKGEICVEDNVAFRNQVDALRCFGFGGSAMMRGIWRVKEAPSYRVWFPKLFADGDWNNSLSEDGKTITEQRFDGEKINPKQNGEGYYEPADFRIVFAKSKDDLGATLYRFAGVFRLDTAASSARLGLFSQIGQRVHTISPPGEYDPHKKYTSDFGVDRQLHFES